MTTDPFHQELLDAKFGSEDAKPGSGTGTPQSDPFHTELLKAKFGSVMPEPEPEPKPGIGESIWGFLKGVAKPNTVLGISGAPMPEPEVTEPEEDLGRMTLSNFFRYQIEPKDSPTGVRMAKIGIPIANWLGKLQEADEKHKAEAPEMLWGARGLSTVGTSVLSPETSKLMSQVTGDSPPGGWDGLGRPIGEDGKVLEYRSIRERAAEGEELEPIEQLYAMTPEEEIQQLVLEATEQFAEERERGIAAQALSPEDAPHQLVAEGKWISFRSRVLNKFVRDDRNRTAAKAVLQDILIQETGVSSTAFNKTFRENIRSSFYESAMGLRRAYRKNLKDLPEPLPAEVMESLPADAQLAMMIGSFIGDLPYDIVGAIAGSVAGSTAAGPAGGVYGAWAGSYALSHTMRKVYADALENGGVKTPADLWDLIKLMFVEVTKGSIIGTTTGKAGMSIPVTKPLQDKFGKVIGQQAHLPSILARGGAEAATLMTIEPLLEGMAPSYDNFIGAAGALASMHLAVGIATRDLKVMPKDVHAKQLISAYRAHGVLPSQVVAFMKDNIAKAPKLFNDFVDQGIIPESTIRAMQDELADIMAAQVDKSKLVLDIHNQDVNARTQIGWPDAGTAAKAVDTPDTVGRATDQMAYSEWLDNYTARRQTGEASIDRLNIKQTDADPTPAAKPEPEVRPEPEPAVDRTSSVISDIEKAFGKNIKDISYPDVKAYVARNSGKKETPVPKAKDGAVVVTESAVEIVDKPPVFESPLYEPDVNVVRMQQNAYAERMSKMYLDKKGAVAETLDPDFTINKMINDINSYAHELGNVNIRNIQQTLDQVASNIELGRELFSTEAAYHSWANKVFKAREFVDSVLERSKVDQVSDFTAELADAAMQNISDFTTILKTQLDPSEVIDLMEAIREIKTERGARHLGLDDLGPDNPTGLIKAAYERVVQRALDAEVALPDDPGVRSKIKQTAEPAPVEKPTKVIRRRRGKADTTLRSGIPIEDVPTVVSDLAKRVIGAGRSVFRNREIYNKTGHWLGQDDQWRYEPNFKTMRVRLGKEDIHRMARSGEEVALSQVLDAPELFDNVPALYDVAVKIDPALGSSAAYEPALNSITVGPKDTRSSLIHELGHVIQNVTDAKYKGTSPEFMSRPYDVSRAIRLAKQSVERLLLENHAEINTLSRPEQSKLWRSASKLSSAEDIGDFYSSLAIDSDILSKIPKTRDQIHNIFSDFFEYKTKARMEPGSAHLRYMKDPGEMEARLWSERFKMSEARRKSEAPWETLDKLLETEADYHSRYDIYKYSPELRDYRTAGTKLYSSVGPQMISDNISTLIKAGKSVSDYMQGAWKAKDYDYARAFGRLKSGAGTFALDTAHDLKRAFPKLFGDRGAVAIDAHNMVKGAPSAAAQFLDVLNKDVFGKADKKTRRAIHSMILVERLIDIAKSPKGSKFKFPEGLSPKQLASYKHGVKYIEGLSDRQLAIVRERVQKYFDRMRELPEKLYKEGIITLEEKLDLQSHNYRRIQLVEVFDRQVRSTLGGKKTTVRDSGIDALAVGKVTDIYEPDAMVAAWEMTSRTYGRVFNQQAQVALKNIAMEFPINPYVRVPGRPYETVRTVTLADGSGSMQTPITAKTKKPTGKWHTLYYMDKGKRKPIYVSDIAGKQWLSGNVDATPRAAMALRALSASPVTKLFATGINWGFAMAQLPIDMIFAMQASRYYADGKWHSTYSPFIPYAVGQMAADQAGVMLDVMARGPQYQKAIENGIGMSFMTLQGLDILRPGKHIDTPMKPLYKFLSYPGLTTEMATRLANINRMVKNSAAERGISFEQAYNDPAIYKQAVAVARDTIDFSQGGWGTKLLDNLFPYLNAGVLGTRNIVRTFEPRSGTAAANTMKIAQLGMISTGLYIASQMYSPKSMQYIKDSYEAENNIILPLGDSTEFTDPQTGELKYMFIKIPLEHSQRFWNSFFKIGADLYMGNEVNVQAAVNKLVDIMPAGLDFKAPLLTAIFERYRGNIDHMGRRISTNDISWPKARADYDADTSGIARDLGQVTGLNPKKLDKSIDAIIPQNSIWAWGAGRAYDYMRGYPEYDRTYHIWEQIAQVPEVRRFLGITNPALRGSKHSSEVREKDTYDRMMQRHEVDRIIDPYTRGNVERRPDRELYRHLGSIKDPVVRDRLQKYAEFELALKGLPNIQFWRRLYSLPTSKARAEVYYEREQSLSADERSSFGRERAKIGAIGGVFSDDFYMYYSQIKRGR